MNIYFKKSGQGKLIEFVGFYKDLLSKCMDPFRRCRAGEFAADSLEPYLISAFEAYGTEDKDRKIDQLLNETNFLLERYYAKTKKDFAISPDVFSFRNVVEAELKRINKEN